MAFKPGDLVEYEPAIGGIERGTVTRIEHGIVFVAIERTNMRGRKVARTGEVWFEPYELDRLRPASKGAR